MLKIFTVVCVLFSGIQAFAKTHKGLSSVTSKNVRLALWYDGVKINSKSPISNTAANKQPSDLEKEEILHQSLDLLEN
jgi:hypothetical protein